MQRSPFNTTYRGRLPGVPRDWGGRPLGRRHPAGDHVHALTTSRCPRLVPPEADHRTPGAQARGHYSQTAAGLPGDTGSPPPCSTAQVWTGRRRRDDHFHLDDMLSAVRA